MSARPGNERVAIVTGGSRGIGRGICVGLAQRGWTVVINYRGNTEAAHEAARLVEEAGGTSLLAQGDIGVAAERSRMVGKILDTYGRIDLLVNNAGMGPRQRTDMLQMTEESYDEVMNTNLKGPFFLTQAVANAMIALVEADVIRDPKIVNIGSISAFAASTNRAEYCISKTGMSMMTALFAARLAEFGINVYEVRPGITETDMTARVKEKYDAMIADGLLPIARWGKPEDVARAVVAIAEGGFPFSTGEIIHVDGGFHLRRL
jgi:3-oxoacyl-[acyl-carrier protein] reductase